ncbi:glycosyltransferase family 25 protein [Vibrio alfacsensis]|jgi:glycosyl transferase family 25|uniref:glycosyltransferase family 25 protein n=1 Tax=Vibrio TaxID=662 RepID=UPI0040696B9B
MDKKIKIYVLTTRNEERVQYLESLLDGIEFEFVESLSEDELRKIEDKFSKASLRFRKKAMMLGEFGAFVVHSMAWERICKSKEVGIVIEDSADFIQDASILLSDEVYNQVVSCGLVSFTDYDYGVERPDDKPVLFDDLKVNKAFPIRCYGLTPETANILLNNMKNSGMVQPVDKWISIHKLSGVSGFLSNIGIAVRRSGLKSIANVKRGKASFNPLNLLYRRINKIKYKY